MGELGVNDILWGQHGLDQAGAIGMSKCEFYIVATLVHLKTAEAYIEAVKICLL